MFSKTAGRLKLFIVAGLLALEASGSRFYTVRQVDGVRSYFGPSNCYHGVAEGLESLRRGQAFGSALQEFFFHDHGRTESVASPEASLQASELDKAPARKHAGLAVRIVPVGDAPEPDLARAAPRSAVLPKDQIPVVPFHLNSKK